MLKIKEIPILEPCPNCGAKQTVSDMTGVFFVQEHIYINGCDAIKTYICCGSCWSRSSVIEYTAAASLGEAAQLGLQSIAKIWNNR